MAAPRRGRRRAFERVYSLVVAGKGLYGSIELLGGAVLLFAPGVAGRLLSSTAVELTEVTTAISHAASRSVADAGAVVAAGVAPFALFLIVHGAVKLLTAYALLRRAIRWYPWALGALGVLLAAQILDEVFAPSIGGATLAVLDVGVILLVSWEYRRLRRDPSPARIGVQKQQQPDSHPSRARATPRSNPAC